MLWDIKLVLPLFSRFAKVGAGNTFGAAGLSIRKRAALATAAIRREHNFGRQPGIGSSNSRAAVTLPG